jgi:shikimate dehydrogenase
LSLSSVILLGDPVSQSLSPALQDAAFQALGIDCRYRLQQVASSALAGAIADIRSDPKVLGANLTIPHKESVMALLDECDPLAERIGAVNTISRRGVSLKGWNTDVDGFRKALAESGYSPEGKSVTIIGAGGAARAVVAALQQPAARIALIARSPDRAQRVLAELAVENGEALGMEQMRTALSDSDLVVNATPADLPPAAWLRPGQRCFDLRSRRSSDGRAMLLHQGAAAFSIWTGQPAPLEIMRAALERAAQAVPA